MLRNSSEEPDSENPIYSCGKLPLWLLAETQRTQTSARKEAVPYLYWLGAKLYSASSTNIVRNNTAHPCVNL